MLFRAIHVCFFIVIYDKMELRCIKLGIGVKTYNHEVSRRRMISVWSMITTMFKWPKMSRNGNGEVEFVRYQELSKRIDLTWLDACLCDFSTKSIYWFC